MKLNDLLWSCPYKKYLGIECFGCGAQTAVLLLLEGKLKESFYSYPALPTLIVLLLVILLATFTKKRKFQKWILPLIILNLLIMVGSYYLL